MEFPPTNGMNLLDLALDPRKALRRFSPFRETLPSGMARRLELSFGDSVTVEKDECLLYSRDPSAPPPALERVLKRKAWAVVRPRLRGELLEILEMAQRTFVPVVPRGSGTSGYGGSVPTEGGIVVDMRGFDRIVRIDPEKGTATVEAGVTFSRLEEELRKHGLALRQYPTSFHGATVGGWISQGGGGVGSARYGPFRNDLVDVLLITPDGREVKLEGEDLDLVYGSFGISGFIVEATLRVRKATPPVPFAATFSDESRALRALRRISTGCSLWSLHFFSPEFAELSSESAGTKILPSGKYTILAVFEGPSESSEEVLRGVVLAEGGELLRPEESQRIWEARFDHLNLKRLGPSVVVGEAVVPRERFEEAWVQAKNSTRAERECLWAIAISPTEFDLIYYALEDERRALYAPSLGNSLAFLESAKKVGGRAYATGVLQSNESEALLAGTPPRSDPLRWGILAGSSLVSTLLLFAFLLGLRRVDPALLPSWASIGFLFDLSAWALSGGWGTVGAFLLVLSLLALSFVPVVFALFRRGLRAQNAAVGFVSGGGILVGVGLLIVVLPSLLSLPFELATRPLSAWALPLRDFILLLFSVIVGYGVLGSIALGLPLSIGGSLLPARGAWAKLLLWKKATDPNDLVNPGPVLGARPRGIPLKIFPGLLEISKGQLIAARGAFPYRGGPLTDPYLSSLPSAFGRIRAPSLEPLAYETTTCIFCAKCNSVAPERGYVWESELPRGRVILARLALEGKARIPPSLHERLARAPFSPSVDSSCPVGIRIGLVTDLLLEEACRRHGPLPLHSKILDSVRSEKNTQGRPHLERTRWATLPFDPEGTVLFFADDLASYEETAMALSSARSLLSTGYPIAYLGKSERTSGALLFECGLGQEARPVVEELAEEIRKRRIRTIVSVDAHAVRSIRHHWPRVLEDSTLPPVLHTTTFLLSSLEAKRIEIEGRFERKVLYHVPEALEGKEREAGIQILQRLGATVLSAQVEECGYGRALDLVDPKLEERLTARLVREALDLGAEALVVSSPGCARTIRKFVKKAKLKIEVLDLHEILLSCLKSKEGGGVFVAPVAEEVEEKPKEPILGPDEFRVEFVKEGVVLAVHKNQSILDAALEAGLELPYSCKAGSCDTCSARYEGAPPDQSAGVALTPEQQKTFVLTCIARPRGPVKIWSAERPR